MISQELRKKIKKIQIHTKRVMQSTLSGDYLSAFKGSGLEFNQLREYQMGDDVRFIDWNSSVKNDKMMVKQFIQERDRTIILAIDMSPSTLFSSHEETRRETIAQIAATLTFIAQHNKDKVGAFFFTDHIETWIPPSKNPAQVEKIMEEIFQLQPTGRGTSINQALRFLVSLKKRNAIVFMLSDWIDESPTYENILKVAGCEYDFIAVRVMDEREKNFPTIGMLTIQDPETGQMCLIKSKGSTNTSDPITLFLQARRIEQKKLFSRLNIDMLDLDVAQPFFKSLIGFFHTRIRRQI